MKNLYTLYAQKIVEHPKKVLTILLLITLTFGAFLTQLKIDATPYVLERQHPSRQNESVIRDTFTNTGEQAMIAVTAKNGTVFNHDTLSLVYNLTNQLNSISLNPEGGIKLLEQLRSDSTSNSLIDEILVDGIGASDVRNLKLLRKHLANSSTLGSTTALGNDVDNDLNKLIYQIKPVRKIRSLSSGVENITSKGDDIDIHLLMKSIPTSGLNIRNLEEEITENEMFNNMLVSPDKRSTTILVELEIPEYDSATMALIYDEMIRITDSNPTQDEMWISGPPVITAQIAGTIKSDNDLFFPFVVLVISIILFVSFRRAQGIAIPLTIAILTTIWTLGLMSAFGIAQNIITTVLPVFLISIGVADAIHFISNYYSNLETQDKNDAAVSTFDHLFVPLFLTSITTISGFLALAYTELTFLREFGLFIAAGVFFAFLITMTLLPALLPLLKQPANSPTKSNRQESSPIIRGVSSINNLFFRNARLSFTVLITIAAISLYVGKDVQIDNENITAFSEDSRLRIDDNKLNAQFGGTIPTSLYLTSDTPGAFTRPDVVIAIDKIAKHLKDTHGVGYTLSSADYIKRLHQVLTGGNYVIPKNITQEEIAQYLFLYENSNAQQLRDVLDHDYQNSRIIVSTKTDQATVWRTITEDTLKYAKTVLPSDIAVEFSGFGYIQSANLTEIVHGQINSIIIATVVISLIMIAIFRSVIVGLISIVPIIMTLLINFSFMRMTGLSLDIGTSLIAGIVFGIGIDYPIHFMAILRRNCKEYGLEFVEGIRASIRSIAKPILINSMSLSFGFLVLCLSSHTTLVKLGMLVSGTMLLCGILALLILPLLTYIARPKVLMPDETPSSDITIDSKTVGNV